MKTINYRKTAFYKTLTPYLATAYAEGFCEGENANDIEKVTAFQYLHDTKLAYSLQGWYGRCVSHLLERGVIKA